jgi:YidC/Oxa1 family membrane protein insertase
MHNIQHKLDPIKAEMQKRIEKNDMYGAQQKRLEVSKILKEHGFSYLKAMYALSQPPIIFAMFYSFKKMGELPIPGLQNGGLWWFTDLTLPDPTYILPAVTAGLIGLSMEAVTSMNGVSRMSNSMKNFLRLMTFVMMYYTSSFPAVLFRMHITYI